MTTRISPAYLAVLLASLVLTPGLMYPARAQMAPTDMLMRIEQLERQLRQVTGTVEQLQYRNQQLEQQVRQLTEQPDARPDAARGAMRPLPPQQRPGTIPPPLNAMTPGAPPMVAAPIQSQQMPQSGGRRSDAFDPNANPDAPGAPRPLGMPGRRSDAYEPPVQTGATPMPRGADSMTTIIANEDPRAVAPVGREPGAPLDLSGRSDQRLAPMPRNTAVPSSQVATLPPSQTPRDEYDLAYGYLLRKDYALAEEGLRDFIQKYPRDRMVADAQFWIGESMYQRQNYREAADAFVAMTKKYENHNKAPDALLRLGQSLAALNERELACATFGEVSRKYPRASQNVKQAAEREQKRARC